MITPRVCEVIWFAGIVGWYVIRYPFERKAKRVRVSKSLFGRRESSLLGFAFLGLCVVPAVYALTGFPKSLDRPFVPTIAWLGLPTLCAGLWLFLRSHADLGGNWSISLEIREQHALVQSGVYRLIGIPCILRFFFWRWRNFCSFPIGWQESRLLRRRGPLRFSHSPGGADDARKFRQRYLSYVARTKRLIPWVV